MPEQTYLIFHPTRLAYLRWYIVTVILVIVSILLLLDFLPIPSTILNYKYYFAFVFIAFALFLIWFTEFWRKHDKYAITSYRVMEKHGIINIKEDAIYWEKVSNYSLAQSFFDRLFKIGTIQVWAVGGESTPEIIIRSAPQIKKIRYVLEKIIQKKTR